MLYRMSYSSIIRESEDLGAGIFDPEGNELAESDSTPMFMGAMPKIVKGVISLLGDDIHDGDVILHNDPYLRRHALTRRRDRGADLLRRRAGRLRGRVGAPARHRRRLSGARRRPRRQLVGGEHLPGGQALRAGRAPGEALAAHPREHPDADVQPRRRRGDDRRLRAGEEAVPPAARALRPRTGARSGEGLDRLLRADAAPGDREGAGRRVRPGGGMARRRRPQPRHPAAGEGEGLDRRRRADDRPDRVERRGADGLQLPVRGHDRLRDDVHRADDLPRRGRVSGVRAAERGDAAADQGGRAEGLDLQPELSARVLCALLPGAARGRPRAPRAGAGRARADHGRQLRAPPLHLLLRLQHRDAGVLGLPRGGRGLVRRPPVTRRPRLR